MKHIHGGSLLLAIIYVLCFCAFVESHIFITPYERETIEKDKKENRRAKYFFFLSRHTLKSRTLV